MLPLIQTKGDLLTWAIVATRLLQRCTWPFRPKLGTASFTTSLFYTCLIIMGTQTESRSVAKDSSVPCLTFFFCTRVRSPQCLMVKDEAEGKPNKKLKSQIFWFGPHPNRSSMFRKPLVCKLYCRIEKDLWNVSRRRQSWTSFAVVLYLSPFG